MVRRVQVRDYSKKILRSRDGRTLLGNLGYLSILQLSGYAFPLITIPYLARTIGVDGYGRIAFALAVVGWFLPVADWGFMYTATRDVAQNRENREKVSDIFSRTIWAQSILMVLSFVILLVLVETIPVFKRHQGIILITFLLVPGRVMFPQWFFQAMERMRYITILNVVSRFIFTISVFVFIKEKSDFILQPLLSALGYLVAGFLSMGIVLFKWKIRLMKPNFTNIFYAIKNSSDVFINNMVPNFYDSFSVMLLGFWTGPIQNGLLDVARKFTGLGEQFMGVISQTFFPFLSRRIDKHSLFVKIYLATALLISIVLFSFAPLVIRLFFTSDFLAAVVALRITSVYTIFSALRVTFGTNYLILERHEKVLRNITITCSIVGFVISFPLIYYFSYVGAAITITATQAILGLTIARKALRIKKSKLSKAIAEQTV